VRLRALALLALLLGVTLAGCIGGQGEGPRLAAPTNATAGPKVPVTPSNPVIKLNFSDPGYRMNGTWRAGDGWDWESDEGRFRTLRVLEARPVGNGSHFLVEETFGKVGNAPNARARGWVDGTAWLRLNETDVQGGLTVYAPGVPLRFTHNGSYNYTQQRYDGLGRKTENATLYANVAYVNNGVVVRLPWGNVATGKLEHRIVAVEADRSQSRTLITRWVAREYQNEVRWQVDQGETFTLSAAKVGDRVYRELRPT
jgi:hypothetical protein